MSSNFTPADSSAAHFSSDAKVSVDDSCGSQRWPRYRIDQTYAWNYAHAPQPAAESDEATHRTSGSGLPSTSLTWSFCGRPVPSPLGISAGPLLNSAWLVYYAELGFDILTYKTVRSRARECYPMPNLVPVADRPILPDEANSPTESLLAASQVGKSWAISFGMPSMAPEQWRSDVRRARSQLAPEKVLVVSVVATPEEDWSLEQVADDYARCAKWAVEAGADCIEVNFSCPNVASCDGQLYQLPDHAALVAERVKQAIGDVPLICKIGATQQPQLARELLIQLDPHVQALSMTNCIPKRVTSEGKQLFAGNARGIGGEAIREASIAQLAMFRSERDRLQLSTRLIGVGGIFSAEHVACYLEAGAESTQVATAAMLNPLLAQQIKAKLGSG